MAPYRIIFLFSLLWITFSCKKCQECTTEMTIFYYNGGGNEYTSTREYCGNEYDYAPKSGLYYDNIQGGYQTSEITCNDID